MLSEPKPTLTLSSRHFPDLPNMRLDDTGTITLHFKVTGANKYTSGEMMDEDEISYTLEYSPESISMDKVNLKDAVERASNIYVKTQTTPAP